jgi:hypothetical protein
MQHDESMAPVGGIYPPGMRIIMVECSVSYIHLVLHRAGDQQKRARFGGTGWFGGGGTSPLARRLRPSGPSASTILAPITTARTNLSKHTAFVQCIARDHVIPDESRATVLRYLCRSVCSFPAVRSRNERWDVKHAIARTEREDNMIMASSPVHRRRRTYYELYFMAMASNVSCLSSPCMSPPQAATNGPISLL